MLNNIKSKQRGFTIVELLIVIVVIAILAAITIVAYNGIQTRAKTNSGQAQANSIVKKFEALNAIKGAYIGTAGGTDGSAINTYADAAPVASEAHIDSTTSVIAATNATTHGLDGASAKNGSVVSAYACAGGANVWYWNYSGSGSAVKVTAGTGCSS